MATIGRRAAVAEIPGGIKLKGSPAWFAWLGLHLVYLVGFRNRFSVFLNWWWNYVTWDRGPRLITDDPEDAAPISRRRGLTRPAERVAVAPAFSNRFSVAPCASRPAAPTRCRRWRRP